MRWIAEGFIALLWFLPLAIGIIALPEYPDIEKVKIAHMSFVME